MLYVIGIGFPHIRGYTVLPLYEYRGCLLSCYHTRRLKKPGCSCQCFSSSCEKVLIVTIRNCIFHNFISVIIQIYRFSFFFRRLVELAYNKLQTKMSNGMSPENSWNAVSVDLVKAARVSLKSIRMFTTFVLKFA